MSFVVSAVEAIAEHLHPGMLDRPRVDDLSGHDRGTGAADARAKRPQGRRRLLPRVLARARRPGQREVPHAQRARRSSAARRRRAARWRRALYRSAIDTVVPVSSPRVAEMVKLLENTFRAVNIGLVNEIALMCDKLGIDVWEVIDAAKTKPFGFMPFYPGPGLGGHCIPIDPFYLSWKAQADRIRGALHRARRPGQRRHARAVVDKIADALNTHRKVAERLARPGRRRRLQAGHRRHPRVAVARRDGPARAERGARVRTPIRSCRRWPARAWHGSSDLKSLSSTPPSMADVDCVAILTDHSAIDYRSLAAAAPLVVDTRNAIKERHPHVFRLGAPTPPMLLTPAGAAGRRGGRVITMLEVVFWSSALFIAYVYVGYGLLLMIWSRLRRGASQHGRPGLVGTGPVRGGASDGPRPRRRAGPPELRCRTVSIVIAARNEAQRLPARIDNLLCARLSGRTPPDHRRVRRLDRRHRPRRSPSFGDRRRAGRAACGRARRSP